MNCNEVQQRLIENDVDSAVEEHLALCAECRREQLALQQVTDLLSQSKAPIVQVDVQAIYQQESERQQRQMRRWKRIAILTSMAAALVMVFLWLRLEVSVDGQQLTIRWGAPSRPREPIPPWNDLLARQQKQKQELRLLSQLLQEHATNVDEREVEQHQKLLRLQGRIEELRQRVIQVQAVTQRDLAALVQTLFEVQKGKP